MTDLVFNEISYAEVADEALPLLTLVAIITGAVVFLTVVAYCWRRRVIRIRGLKAQGKLGASPSATSVVVVEP